MQIFLMTAIGKTHPLKVEPTDLIEDIKNKIQYKIGLSPEQQRFVCLGRVLEDGKALAYYNIQENSKIHIIERKIEFRLHIRENAGEPFDVIFLNSDLISGIKQKIFTYTLINYPLKVLL